MILLLGSTGYVARPSPPNCAARGTASSRSRARRSITPISPSLFDYVRKVKPAFIINAAGYRGRPNVDACEDAREDTLFANTAAAADHRRVCSMTDTPWGTSPPAASTAGPSSFSRRTQNVEGAELRRCSPNARSASAATRMGRAQFCLPAFALQFLQRHQGPGGRSHSRQGRVYIWRPGMPFNERSEPRNLLWRLQHYSRVYDGVKLHLASG